MEDKYSLKFTPKGAEDLDNIYQYISEKLFAGSTADIILRKINKEILRLKEFPFSCNYVSDEHLRSKGYRKLIIDNFIVFFYK